MAIKTVNNTIEPNDLVSTLFVFGTFPRIAELNPLTLFITKHIILICKAIIEIFKIWAKTKITTILYIRNSPNTKDIIKLLIDSNILV